MNILKIRDKTISSLSLAVIGAAVVLLIAGITYYVQQDKQRHAIEQQTARTNQLILDLKASVDDNHKLQQENRNYAYCNAVLLAKYTQDQQPIVIDDLNKCILNSFPRDGGPSVGTQSNAQAFLSPSTSTQTLQPAQNGTNGTNGTNGSNGTSGTSVTVTPPNPVITVPSVPALPLPCINLLQIIQTCK